MANDYDISEAFQRVEEEMINSMIRNMKRHITTEQAEGLNYSQWQAEQLAALDEYRKRNAKEFGNYFSTINTQIDEALKQCYKNGNMDQEIAILEAMKKGFTPKKIGIIGTTYGDFFKINDRKMNSLLKATRRDMQRAETAMLRMANDQYRKAIFNAGVYYESGAATLEKAVDMATKDYLSSGLNCIEYANGRRVPIDVYASMALRTTATRSYLAGEATMRDKWGINTVIVNKRGVACPRCLQWVGRVYYDDVWGSVPVTDDKYPRLSTAIQGGLYHPNCKDSHTTYFDGINSEPTPMTEAQQEEAQRVYDLEQQQRYNERMIRKYKRLRDGSLDDADKSYYTQKTEDWQQKNADFIEEHGDVLKRRYENEKIRGITGFTEPPPAPKIPKPPKIDPPKIVEPPKAEPPVAKVKAQTLDEYLAERGLSSPISDYTIDKVRIPHGESARQQAKRIQTGADVAREYSDKRNAAIAEYNKLVESGTIRDKTRLEKLLDKAHGHDDNDSVQAARRLLEKHGIDWKTGEIATNVPAKVEIPTVANPIDFGDVSKTKEQFNRWEDTYNVKNANVKLDIDELKAIDDYTEGGFVGINGVSRGKGADVAAKGFDVEMSDKRANALEKALAKYNLDTDIVTHRFETNVDWITGNGNDVESLKSMVGKTFKQDGFTSSSLLPQRTRFGGGHADAVHIEIITPKGTNGAYLSMSKKGEQEFLYNRGTKYAVLDGGERYYMDTKFNIKTMQMESVKVKERFLKVIALPNN